MVVRRTVSHFVLFGCTTQLMRCASCDLGFVVSSPTDAAFDAFAKADVAEVRWSACGQVAGGRWQEGTACAREGDAHVGVAHRTNWSLDTSSKQTSSLNSCYTLPLPCMSNSLGRPCRWCNALKNSLRCLCCPKHAAQASRNGANSFKPRPSSWCSGGTNDNCAPCSKCMPAAIIAP